MLEILKKFFRFCNERERREFYVSIVLGVIAALLSALKLPAIAVCLQAILTGGTTSKAIILSLIIMLVSAEIPRHRFADGRRLLHHSQ